MSLLMRYKWETLPHPPHSPDLILCDIDLFPRLKENMRGVRFEDSEELEEVMAEQVQLYERGCLTTGICCRWRSVIEHKGHYFEGFCKVSLIFQIITNLERKFALFSG